MQKKSRFFKIVHFLFRLSVGIFAVIGFAFTFVFVAMQFDLLNVRGSIAQRNDFFTKAYESLHIQKTDDTESGTTASSTQEILETPCLDIKSKICDWKVTPEWEVIKGGLTKDSEVIKKVSKETGVSARMITAVVIPEQIRFFTSNREVFKRWFEPMKILGTLTKFSLGVSGIKLETAEQIELNLKDPTSIFYPSAGMLKLVAYKNENQDNSEELFNRLTNEDDHYYSYLYTALYIKEVTAQWHKAGYDISDKPEALVTLFNIGFKKSIPSPSPLAGGANITVGGKTYVYGELGSLYYYSNELSTEFPRNR